MSPSFFLSIIDDESMIPAFTHTHLYPYIALSLPPEQKPINLRVPLALVDR